MIQPKTIYSEDLNKDGSVSKLEAFPYWIDKLRIFPRAFITVYIYMFYNVVEWFMALEDPNMAQAGLVSVVVGAGAAWFGLYVNSRGDSKNEIPSQPQIVFQPQPNNNLNNTYMPPGEGQG